MKKIISKLLIYEKLNLNLNLEFLIHIPYNFNMRTLKSIERIGQPRAIQRRLLIF